MLIGNLGADPEVRYMPSGETVTNIRIATSRRWKDRNSGEQREETEWHRITFFNIGNFKLAEIAGEYLKKGSKVYVEGRLKTSKYQKNGTDQYSTDIIADQMQMLDSRAGGTAEFNPAENQAPARTNQAPQQNQPYQAPQQNPSQPQQPYQAPQQNQPYQAQQPQQPYQAPQQNQPPQQAPQQAPQQNYQGQNQQPPLQPPPAQRPQTPQQPYNQPSTPKTDDYDDDIPF